MLQKKKKKPTDCSFHRSPGIRRKGSLFSYHVCNMVEQMLISSEDTGVNAIFINFFFQKLKPNVDGSMIPGWFVNKNDDNIYIKNYLRIKQS